LKATQPTDDIGKKGKKIEDEYATNPPPTDLYYLQFYCTKIDTIEDNYQKSNADR
jgi:hypothetical protein